MHYHDSDDLKRLGEFKQLAPKEFSAFVEFDKTVGRDDGQETSAQLGLKARF